MFEQDLEGQVRPMASVGDPLVSKTGMVLSCPDGANGLVWRTITKQTLTHA